MEMGGFQNGGGVPLIKGSFLGSLLEALGLCLVNKICLSSGYGVC